MSLLLGMPLTARLLPPPASVIPLLLEGRRRESVIAQSDVFAPAIPPNTAGALFRRRTEEV